MALSFGLDTSAMTPFTLASGRGLSMGTDTRDRDSGDPRRGTFATGGGANWSLGGSTLKAAPSKKTTTRKPLSYGRSVPKFTPTFSRTNSAPLSYGRSVPKMSNNRFDTGSGASSFLKTFSLGSLVGEAGTGASNKPIYTRRGPPPSVLSSPAQVDTVTIAGGSGVKDAAGGLAAQIFSDMLTPASAQGAAPAGGASAEFGGGQSGGGSFMDGIGTMEIVIGAAALGLAFMLLSGGSRPAPRKRAPARRAPARRKKR